MLKCSRPLLALATLLAGLGLGCEKRAPAPNAAPHQSIGASLHHFDFNGDAVDDLVIGAYGLPTYDTLGGAAYIFFGARSAPASRCSTDAEIQIVSSKRYDGFGATIAAAGDVNADGYSDLIVAASSANHGRPSGGCAHIYLGGASPARTQDQTTASVTLVGKKREGRFGIGVSTAGDVNGDGFTDVIIAEHAYGASPREAFVFFGRPSFPDTIDANSSDLRLFGATGEDLFGWSVSTAGDFNGDGFADIIVGACRGDGVEQGSGCAYIFAGQKTLGGSVAAEKAEMRLMGNNRGDSFGSCVCSAGDLNGDGVDDVAVAAPVDDDGAKDAGCVFIFFGQTGWQRRAAASTADVVLVGAQRDDHFGDSVSGVADFNGDGIDDLLVGAHDAGEQRSRRGCAYVFYGGRRLNGTIDASDADVILVGNSPFDCFGRAASTAGDVNGDGLCDIVVGAHGDDDAGDKSGSAFVFFGRRDFPRTARASDADLILVGQRAHREFGRSVAVAPASVRRTPSP